MKNSTVLNALAVVAFTLAVVAFYLQHPLLTLALVVVGAGAAFAAGRAMTREPVRRSRHDEDE